MYQKKKINKKKLYVLGIALFCGLLLLSVDDCEDMSMVEREQYARALREKNDTALAARMEREQALQAEREKASADQAARTRAEQERNAAANTPRQQAPQAAQSQSSTQPASSAGAGAASGTAQTAAAENQPAAQPTGRGTAAQNTAAGGAAAAAPQENAAQADSNGANYVSSIAGKSWKLTELRFADKTVILNRGELSGEEADIFTLAVDNERISGKGAPNRYFTPYQAGANNALTLRPIAGTMMAAIITNPLRIREPDYFQYLAKVTSWKLNQNKLELNSLDKTNKELVLVFSN